ncbi:MAG TPA: CocE/NonD family hydrolase [Solirubrobacteraceae bacterium]|nr:CocE/NonD family hydrolase [Solirubrobacteraceae bacterium]
MEIQIDKNVEVRMRDGVALAADVFRPAGEGRYPALLQRIPYNKEPGWLRDSSVDVLKLVQSGYVVVHQDTRGAGASEGEYRPFVDDRMDGADTVAWAAAQPWSTGDVGMIGISYTAGTQWLAAMETPPQLKAIAPHSFHHDPYLGWLYQGGAFLLGFAIRWSVNYFSPAVRDQIKERAGTVDLFSEYVRRLPTSDMPMLQEAAPFYFEWLAHPTYDAYWRDWSPSQHFEDVAVPALITTGWYDALLAGGYTTFVQMKKRGATAAARRPHLNIGPWAHSWWGADFPERGYGERADKEVFDLTGRTARWFDHYLKGIDNGVNSDKPVNLFIMGANQWREEDDWPLPDTQFTNYYLHSGGHASTAHGDGELSADPPDDEREDVYLYNPFDPVPTIGGQTLLPPARMPANAGPRDQRALDGRPDILFFTTRPLDHDVEVTGPVQLKLFISSSAPDTDFTGKLVDVHPDGRAEILTDGILRVRYRESFSEPKLMEPGEIYEINVDLLATGNLFKVGHRIRLEVSSSSFPRWDRNTNTGNNISTDTEADVQVAVNRVYHDRDHPSHLILPIISRD